MSAPRVVDRGTDSERKADLDLELAASGRYSVFAELACGGMAMVFLGQLEGGHGFKRSVAVKKMHPQYARDPDFRGMFLDEARLVAKIRHPNVVPTLDVLAKDTALLIVMEFVEGESVLQIMQHGKKPVPPRIAAAIAHDTLCGLHAAHELRNEDAEPLGVIHRDVSPANILVGKDGLARIIDFGVAKAAGRSQTTKDGAIKGKVPYMPPEQLWGSDLDRTVDVYATSVVLWEMLTGKRLFKGETDTQTMKKITDDEVVTPSIHSADASPLDEVVMRGLSRDPSKRYPTAIEMAKAIEKALSPAPRLEIAEWLQEVAGDALAERDALVRAMQRGDPPPPSPDLAAVALVLTQSAPRTDVAQSMSRPPGGTQPRGADGWSRFGFAGALIVLATIGGVVVMRSSSNNPSTANTATATAMPMPIKTETAAATATAASISAPLPVVAPPTASTASTVMIATGAPAPIATPPKTRDAGAVATTPSLKAGCQPPYTLDAEGNRHYKVECL